MPLSSEYRLRAIRLPRYLGSIMVWTDSAVTSVSAAAAAEVAALMAMLTATGSLASEEAMLTDRFGGAYANIRNDERPIPFIG
jgi:protein-S-isoprenylcysteine O-methyltransferase Ste14